MSQLHGEIKNRELIQVNCNRTVSDATFALGSLDFDINTNQNQLLGKNSYMSMKLQITKINDFTPIGTADNLAPNMDIPACLFDSVTLKVNGQPIYTNNEYPQSDILIRRLYSSSNRLDVIDDILIFTNPDFSTRHDAITTATSELPPDPNSVFDIVFQPLCFQEIFRYIHDVGLAGQAKYTLSFQPNNNYKIQALQMNPFAAPLANPLFKVLDMYLYAEVYTSSYEPNFSYMLTVPKSKMHREPLLEGNNGFNTKTFQLSPTCKAVSVCFQDSRAGSNYQYPITFLSNVETANEKDLVQIQLNYLGKNYTPTPYQLEQTYDGVNFLKKDNTSFAYYANIIQYENNPVPESQQFWSARGQFYYFKLYNPDNVKNNNMLNVRYKFSAVPANTNMLVFEHDEDHYEFKVVGKAVKEIRLM